MYFFAYEKFMTNFQTGKHMVINAFPSGPAVPESNAEDAFIPFGFIPLALAQSDDGTTEKQQHQG